MKKKEGPPQPWMTSTARIISLSDRPTRCNGCGMLVEKGKCQCCGYHN